MKNTFILNGIQQMGIGVPDVQDIWSWYRKAFGLDVRIFEEAAPAPLMTRYTGGEVQHRTATLALNMAGGGGFEIWQFTSRPTMRASFEPQLGDFGVFICKIKSEDVRHTQQYLQHIGANVSPAKQDPAGRWTCYVQDPNGNYFQIVEGRSWFTRTKHPSKCGGVAGAVIGVSDIDQSQRFYQDLLGYEQLVYDQTQVFDDFDFLPRGQESFRRVLLSHANVRSGYFAQLLGVTEIELVELSSKNGVRQIFENRFWGDWGFIHLCFDVQGMNALKERCAEFGTAFTVDSDNSFDMGEAAGRFAYIEDPDGYWIEFVETHKVPIFKKLGLYLNLKQGVKPKHLPKWMLKALGLNRVK
jgi:catechol 2,3-dioxygenase-like lactoylglutathione lyase family enzyme